MDLINEYSIKIRKKIAECIENPRLLIHILKNLLQILLHNVLWLFYRTKFAILYYFKAEKKRLFFIVYAPRSGSKLLVDYLNSIPGNCFIHQILHPTFAQKYLGLNIRTKFISKKSTINFLRNYLNTLDADICGCKMESVFISKYKLSIYDLHKSLPSAKFIILYRQKLAEQFRSLKIAELTKFWGPDPNLSSSENVAKTHHGKICIDVQEFIKFCDETKLFYENLLHQEWAKNNAILIKYEDLVANHQKVFNEKVFPILGLKKAPVNTSLTRLNPSPLSESISNYDQIKKVFKSNFANQEYEL